MRRRQHGRIRYGSWVPLTILVVLGGILFFVMGTMPFVERSGEVTDMWEDNGFYRLEIDNSFTESVDDFEYNNIRVGDVYEWKTLSQTAGVIAAIVAVSVVPLVLMVMFAKADEWRYEDD